jgi:hypothetical protein
MSQTKEYLDMSANSDMQSKASEVKTQRTYIEAVNEKFLTLPP